MPKDESQADDNPEESSPPDNQSEESSVSEDDKTQDSQEEEEAEEVVEEEPKEGPQPPQKPFHEHPRFQELISSNRDLKDQISKLQSEREEQQRVATMSKEERAVYDLKKKYGFATTDDIKVIKQENDRLKEQMVFEQFLRDNPEAAAQREAIQALAFTPKFNTRSYEQIWKEIFQGQSKDRKVVKRTVKTGIAAKASLSKSGGGGKYFTREQVAKMDAKTFAKNEVAIMKQMAEGKIK